MSMWTQISFLLTVVCGVLVIASESLATPLPHPNNTSFATHTCNRTLEECTQDWIAIQKRYPNYYPAYVHIITYSWYLNDIKTTNEYYQIAQQTFSNDSRVEALNRYIVD